MGSAGGAYALKKVSWNASGRPSESSRWPTQYHHSIGAGWPASSRGSSTAATGYGAAGRRHEAGPAQAARDGHARVRGVVAEAAGAHRLDAGRVAVQRGGLDGRDHQVEGVAADGEAQRVAHTVLGTLGDPARADEDPEVLVRGVGLVEEVDPLRHDVAAGLEVDDGGVRDVPLLEPQVRGHPEDGQPGRRVRLEEGELERERAARGVLEVADPVPPLDRRRVARVVARQLDGRDRVRRVVDARRRRERRARGEDKGEDDGHGGRRGTHDAG